MAKILTGIVKTPCGFEIWATVRADHTLDWRVLFQGQDVGLDYLNQKLSAKGARLLGAKLTELTAALPINKE